ncbi:MAG: glycosyltransferase, partial [Gammaproteobacteria bacterium]
VLLSRDFRSFADKRGKDCEDTARNLLVTMGGADPGNDTLSALQALADADAAFNVRVVAGAANRHVDAIQDFCRSQPGNYELLVDTKEMPAVMNWADLAIAAAGTTSWELLYMGVPTVLVAIASNQEPIGTGIEKRGAGKYLGHRDNLDWNVVAETSLALAADDNERRSLIDAGRALVDGEGVVRVADELRQMEEG